MLDAWPDADADADADGCDVKACRTSLHRCFMKSSWLVQKFLQIHIVVVDNRVLN